MFSALLDACVLYPVGPRDLLLSVAERGVYAPYWSKEILEEMARNIADSGRSTPERVAGMCEQMNRAFPAALVEGYEALIPSMTNQHKDRHVLAAAVRANVSVIVTDNKKDFPSSVLADYDIEAQTADEFLTYALDHDTPAVLGALRTMSTKRRNPPVSERGLLDTLAERLPRFSVEATALLTRSG